MSHIIEHQYHIEIMWKRRNVPVFDPAEREEGVMGLIVVESEVAVYNPVIDNPDRALRDLRKEPSSMA